MKILLAVDGSDYSRAAADEVARLPWPAGSEVRILACVSVFIGAAPGPFRKFQPAYEDWMVAERERLSAVVEEAAAKMRSSSDLKVETAVIDGPPRETIVEDAEKWGADLIVVGSHGYGPVKKLLLGSVSQAVAAQAGCSVHIVRVPVESAADNPKKT